MYGLPTTPVCLPTTAYSNARCIASSGDTVHVVWRENRDGNYEIYYKRSTDGGISWGTDTRISNNVYYSSNPSISISGSDVHIVWEDNRDGITAQNYQIYYNRSSDGGTSWGTDTRLTNDPTTAENPSVSSSGPVVLVVWNHRDAGGVYTAINYKRSTDGGISWGEDKVLTNDPGAYWHPCVSVSESEVHVVWLGGLVNKPAVGYKRSTDGGINWGANTWLTGDSIYTDCPSVSASGSSVHVLWLDARENTHYQIYYKNSTDGGKSWGADTRLTTNFTYAALHCTMSVSGPDVHVVWPDNRDGNFEIYYVGSKDGGKSWGAETRLTNNSSISTYPFVSASGTVVHLIWQDNRDGNFEIYYKRDPTGNVTGIENSGSELPETFILEQNYPNPFNPSTKINYSIPQAGLVSLKVFDVLGKEVTTLVNEEKPAGTYEVNFSAKGGSASGGNAYSLSSGIYFYKLQAGSFISTKKMILIK